MTPELPEGLKVWFEYTETYHSPTGRSLALTPPGGLRRCVTAHVVDAETRKEVATGTAVCNPCDQFVRKTGRAKALGRALGELSRAEQ